MLFSGFALRDELSRNSAFLKATTDASSERLLIIERATGKIVWHCRTDGGQTIKKILPVKYANNPALTCILFDDPFTEDVAIVDGVTCQLIDASTFDMASA